MGKRRRLGFASALIIGAAILGAGVGFACGSDDAEPVETPTAQENAAYCREVQSATTSLIEMKDALVPFDQVALVEARADARASIEYLYTPAEELQGGADALADLKEDLAQLNRLFATPDLAANADAIRAQADVVAGDLESMKALGHCP